ncbi:MAG: Rrf2 family transcriptional regulator [Clostridiales bacterium]|jgi:Rrf2 family protein|nr:Rrf2 family transcriptional regulator [Clostridiales bacterium]
MRISTKGRYGVAVMASLAERAGQQQTAVDVAKKLGISKIYLEQVLSLLKNAGLVQSVKGSQGGYFLDAAADKITVLEILRATETGLFERTELGLDESSAYIERAINNTVWTPLDKTLAAFLGGITLQAILDNSKTQGAGYMFYI